MYHNFSVDMNDTIVVITLNRPEKRNPINEEMLGEFEQIVIGLRDDPSSRAVILTGTGNSFCAGADLSMVKGVTDAAEDLYSWGMIDRVVAPDLLLEAAHDFAKRLIAKGSRAVSGAKLTVNAIAAVAAQEVTTVQPEWFIHPPNGRGVERGV